MMRKNLLLIKHDFTLQLQGFNNGSFLNLTRFILKTNSKQLVRYMNVKVLCKQNTLLKRLKHNIPLQYASVNSFTNLKDNLYIVDKIVAKKFVSLIKADLQKNTSHVIELNPGFGLVTEELLNIGIPFVHIYEKENYFMSMLKELCNKFPNKLSVQKANLYNISKSMHINNIHSNIDITYNLLKNVKHKKWNEKSCMQVIGATGRIGFLRHLILSTVFQTCFMVYGRPIFYLAVPPFMWNKFAGTKIRSNSVMFQTIFDYHVFGEVSSNAFVTYNKKSTQKFSPLNENDCNKNLSSLYVVKIEPKREVPILDYGKNELFYFWYFIRHHLYHPADRIIPSLEKLIPGCGIRLIALNMNVFTQYKDLSIKQMQDLYVEFRSWPEFEKSMFVSNAADVKYMLNNYIVKEEENHKYDSSGNAF